VIVFAGSDDSEDKVVLQSRSAKYELKTTTKEAPRSRVHICDPVDVNLTALLTRLSERFCFFMFCIVVAFVFVLILCKQSCSLLLFTIERGRKQCKTPRRNPEVEEALVLMRNVGSWGERVKQYLLGDVFPLQKGAYDVAGANDDAVFVAAVPLFAKQQEQQQEQTNVEMRGLIALADEKAKVFKILFRVCCLVCF
jgi:hypothetical protein